MYFDRWPYVLSPLDFQIQKGKVSAETLQGNMVCRGLVTFVKSFPPIQEFPLNLPLMKLLATLSGTVARTALPRALQALAACKKQEKPYYSHLFIIYNLV